MLLTGDRIDAAEAYRIGLVTRLAADRKDTIAVATQIAGLIGARPPTAIAYAKEAAVAGIETDLVSGLRIEKGLFALLTGTADRSEAAAAFREKRPARFTGL
jgi:enoyl-CoA hydratase/carnithine racemase